VKFNKFLEFAKIPKKFFGFLFFWGGGYHRWRFSKNSQVTAKCDTEKNCPHMTSSTAR